MTRFPTLVRRQHVDPFRRPLEAQRSIDNDRQETGLAEVVDPPAADDVEDEAVGCVPIRHRVDDDAGMSTVEYAVGTVVAAAFAAVLYRIVTGDSIVAGLTDLVQSALNTNF